MQNLVDTVLDYLLFLEFSEEEELDPDTALKRLENLSWEIQESWTIDEKQALSEAAARRLIDYKSHPESDEYLSLKAVSEGRFNGYLNLEED